MGEDGVNDAWHENQMLNSELQSLRTRVKALSETVEALTQKNALLIAEKAAGHWVAGGGAGGDVTGLVQGYVLEIEELRARLLEAEAMYHQLKKRQTQMNTSSSNPYVDTTSYIINSDSASVLNEAKRELQKEMENLATLKNLRSQNVNKEDNDGEEVENGQSSLSDDDSDDESDRKGKKSY